MTLLEKFTKSYTRKVGIADEYLGGQSSLRTLGLRHGIGPQRVRQIVQQVGRWRRGGIKTLEDYLVKIEERP